MRIRQRRKRKNDLVEEINYEKLAKHIVATLKSENVIDYGKITEAIVEANAEIQQRKDENDKKHLKHRLNLIKNANGAIYMAIVAIAVLVLFKLWKGFSFSSVDILVENFVISILMIVIIVEGFLSQQEALDDDADMAVSHFSINLALIAVIIAVVL